MSGTRRLANIVPGEWKRLLIRKDKQGNVTTDNMGALLSDVCVSLRRVLKEWCGYFWTDRGCSDTTVLLDSV